MYNTHHKGSPMRIHVWDFGGQEITYSTHQFFLTHRTLYFLVDNARQNHKRFLDFPFNYWLNVISVLGGESPVLIVQNEIGDVSKEIEFEDMKKHIPNLRECVRVNPETYRGMPELIEEMEHYAKKLELIEISMPADWETIRKCLEKEAETNDYITIARYLEICAAHNIPERERALDLSKFLHDLGVFLHFQNDPRLHNFFILKKEWATNAVYKLVENDKIRERRGRFNLESLKTLWNEKAYEDRWNELLSLMMKFELCHPLLDEDGEYLIPQLLPIEKPSTDWQLNTSIVLYYQYDFMPLGIMPFFIVRMHKYLLKNTIETAWRSGVRLEKKNGSAISLAKAEIEETEFIRTKMIKIHLGNGIKKDSQHVEVEKFLYLIVEAFDSIHDKLNLKERKKPKKMVPCCCTQCKGSSEPCLFDYENLKGFREWKERQDCPKSGESVIIDNLLHGLRAVEDQGKKTLKIFVSYNSEDEDFRVQLTRFMEPMINSHYLEVYYDKKEVPGEVWNPKIKSELIKSNIFLFLASAASLASRYCNEELKIACELQKEGKMQIIPILLKPCDWQNSRLKDFNTIPQKGIPITDLSLPSEHHKLNEVTNQLQRTIIKYREENMYSIQVT